MSSVTLSPAELHAVSANPNRSLSIVVEGREYLRLPVQTPILTGMDDVAEIARVHAAPRSHPGDFLFISEKAVAVTQGRAVPESELRIGFTARVLWRFVQKTPCGIGLRRPSSMQCAVNECGAARIWLAAVAGAVGKLFGRRGDFYRVAGPQAAMIDAATTSPLQPECVIMGPKDPDEAATRVYNVTGLPTAIVDVNDIGGSWVVGASPGIDRPLIEKCLKDNPLGQGSECTPMGLLRVAAD